jgi:hypothetical protein
MDWPRSARFISSMRACLHSYLGMTSCTKHGTGSQQYDLYGPIHGWVMLKWYDVFRSLLLLVNFFIVFDLFHVISMYYFSTLTWRSVMFPNAAKPNNGNLTVPPESSKDPSLSNIYLYIYMSTTSLFYLVYPYIPSIGIFSNRPMLYWLYWL